MGKKAWKAFAVELSSKILEVLLKFILFLSYLLLSFVSSW